MIRIPRPALALGLAGLLPTLAAVLLMLMGRSDLGAIGLQIGLIYGCAIFSFIGGAWWGLAAKVEDMNALTVWLTISVMPSLLAALVLWLFNPAAVVVLALAFLASPLIDRRLHAAGLTPDWWLMLRLPLSVAMGTLHLLIAALA